MSNDSLTISGGFSISENAEKLIAALDTDKARKAATALATVAGKQGKGFETARRTAAEAVEAFNRSAAINLSIIAESAKFGKDAAFKGIGEFASAVFNLEKARTSQLVAVGKTFYRSEDETAVELVDHWKSGHLQALLPLRVKDAKSGSVSFPFALVRDALDKGELTHTSTVEQVKKWVEDHKTQEGKVDHTYHWKWKKGDDDESFIGTETEFVEAHHFDEGDEIRLIYIKPREGEKFVDASGLAYKIAFIVNGNYTKSKLVYRMPYKPSAEPVKHMSNADRLRALLASMSPEEIAEIMGE